MGKSSAPKPDKRIGQAALRAADLGEEYLTWMQDQAQITKGWAEEDRARHQDTFLPLQDRMIQRAMDEDSPEQRAARASEAVADVRQQAEVGRDQRNRQMASKGVNPASGRFAGETRRAGMAEDLAAAGAANTARRQSDAMADGALANAVNLGQGLAVNPGTSMGISSGAAGQGFQGAMSGHQQMGNMLGQQYQTQMQAWQANQNMWGGVGTALGSIAGALPFQSSKDSKTKKRKSMGVLDAVKNMPVEEWEYKQGMGDGGGRKHVGPYAEDFQRATGLGNGREISVIDAVGVNMGATQELASQVDRLESKIDSMSSKKSGRKRVAA